TTGATPRTTAATPLAVTGKPPGRTVRTAPPGKFPGGCFFRAAGGGAHPSPGASGFALTASPPSGPGSHPLPRGTPLPGRDRVGEVALGAVRLAALEAALAGGARRLVQAVPQQQAGDRHLRAAQSVQGLDVVGGDLDVVALGDPHLRVGGA